MCAPRLVSAACALVLAGSPAFSQQEPLSRYGYTSGDGLTEPARAMMGRKDYDGAIAFLDDLAIRDPSNWHIFDRRGDAKAAKHDFTGAAADFDRVLVIAEAGFPNDVDNPYYQKVAATKLDAGDWLGALRICNRVIARFDHPITFFLERGIAEERLGRIDAALVDLDACIAKWPGGRGGEINYALVFTERASCRLRRDDADGAIADCNQALELGANKFDAYFLRAAAKSARGYARAATGDYTRALALVPNSAETLQQRGYTYVVQGDFPKACADFAAAFRLDPQHCQGSLMFEAMLLDEPQRSAAKAQFAQAYAPLADRWSVALAGYVSGDLPEASFLAAANDGTPAAASQQCDALYYAGLRHCQAGDTTEGKRLLQAAVATQQIHEIEYSAARAELHRRFPPPPFNP